MRIAVITFPLINNYGGIIQAYALMKLLSDLGHDPVLINFQSEKYFKSLIKYIVKKYILFFIKKYRNSVLTKKNYKLREFINLEINPKSQRIYNSKELYKYFLSNDFDACIVGSDQVFAKLGYSNFENDYSLGFLNKNIIKLSYAASFGGDKFLGDIEKIKYHSDNLKKFRKISVREKSGIKVCQDTFGIEAVHVLDPTMVIDKSYYINLIPFNGCAEKERKLFAYILDHTHEKEKIISKIAESKQLSVKKVSDGNSSNNVLSMEEWLGNIYNSDYIITDSFHGCVFCIIFNKPFNCIINNKRGADRFHSLLSLFNLENRILVEEYSEKNITPDIDWNIINNKIKLLQDYSINFLKNNLI
ncbi:TPA: polysaccharide pyruvyl transferase family protein [Proteus mirabilis]|uniref:polysaccharide pyruvyl transferase family protein n=1 Tax=Proteus mirabilis TaxID=584 RepID=UPI0013DF9820|nr:polysaccharide pyruvyl transferase family protein [Proteus mirabilis]EKW7427491.1 polysaccharide pyruvyl transferase family protein [Proteus mirabilis]ELB1231543.1 polysaccharide pyruvyl transferase family protein [Proteus mirabilis]MCL8580741.1 polysaccharide pyruvyl transferase family protein [Proteus mirabilis]MCL8591907.1 polysaccharide pyruvyl transferase family protein [Proteus mirabilis]MCL8605943.1 polysaccharide pyruvyl transferase family protein [Proteus mirabilis]